MIDKPVENTWIVKCFYCGNDLPIKFQKLPDNGSIENLWLDIDVLHECDALSIRPRPLEHQSPGKSSGEVSE